MAEVSGIRILEKEANKKGDLFARLMKDLFLALGYDHPRLNIHKSGREIDIQAEHRTEKRWVTAECKATKTPIGGDDVNKFVGALDVEKKKSDMPMEGYYISLSGFKETAVQQEKEAGDRVILIDGNRVIEELINGRIITAPLKAVETAARFTTGVGEDLRREGPLELLAHPKGWMWAVCFGRNKHRSHVVFIHADGEAIAPEPASEIMAADKTVGGALHALEYLPPPGRPSSSEKGINQALEKYKIYLEHECGGITLEGMPADGEVGPRRFNLENLFVPLHLQASNLKKPDKDTSPRPLWRDDKVVSESDEDVDETPRKTVGKVLSKSGRLAILAAPGGGKSTLIKRLVVAYAFPERFTLVEDNLPDKLWLPLFIRCRQLGDKVTSPMNDILCDIPSRAEMKDLKEAFSLLVRHALREGNVLLLVDGLDEISDDSGRVSFVIQLRTFLSTYPNVNVVVTSREAGFRAVAGALSAQCDHYTVAGFNGKDIRRLTLSWHKEVVGDQPKVKKEAEQLVRDICKSDRVRQLAKNPLLLTTLLLVKRWVGQLPTRRTVLYGKAVEVLLMTWNVEAHEPMDPDEAVPQLAFTAFTMMKEGVQRISIRRLREVLISAREQMPEILGYAKLSVAEFIKRVEYRSSLLMMSGHEVEDGTLHAMYEFRHLTFQEYLTARAVVGGFYPDRKDGDTLVSILKPHLIDGDWKEVIPLAAVLAGRNVQPLVEYLIEECKKLINFHWDREPKLPVILLSQCILDEVQLAPTLLKEALEWIARRIDSDYSTIPIQIFEGRYGEVFLEAVQDAYMRADSNLDTLGEVLRQLHEHQIDWTGKGAPPAAIYDEISRFLDSETPLHNAVGALIVEHIAYYYSGKEKVSGTTKERLRVLGDRLVVLLDTEESNLHHAVCWAFGRLGVAVLWTPRRHPGVLPRLLELWRQSPLPDVQANASWALSVLSIIERESTPLPEPDEDWIDFIRKKYFGGVYYGLRAALVIGYYLRKPWTDEALTEMIKNVESSGSGWERNQERMLAVLKKGES